LIVKTILLLGAGTGSPDAVPKFKNLGVRIIMAELRDVFDYKKCAPADEIILTDYCAPGFIDFALKLRETWHYDVAVSITEVGVAVAAQINERIGARGSNQQAIARLKDKSSMRELLNEHGFGTVGFRLIERDDDIDMLAASVGYPLIIKPFDGGGSLGIHLAHDARQARQAVAALRAEGLTPLAEQYIDGKEYSVESFSFNGQHVIAAITEKVVNDQFIEVGHVVPARLDEATAAQVGQFVRQFLELVGVTNGPGHTEMKINSAGLMKIIESHNRVGGDNIPKLVELARDVDLISLTGQWACGLVDARLPAARPRGAAAINFFVFPEGEVVDVQGLDKLGPGSGAVEYRCIYAKGDVVRPLTSNSTRAGYVVACGETPDAAIDKVRQLARGVAAVTR